MGYAFALNSSPDVGAGWIRPQGATWIEPEPYLCKATLPADHRPHRSRRIYSPPRCHHLHSPRELSSWRTFKTSRHLCVAAVFIRQGFAYCPAAGRSDLLCPALDRCVESGQQLNILPPSLPPSLPPRWDPGPAAGYQTTSRQPSFSSLCKQCALVITWTRYHPQVGASFSSPNSPHPGPEIPPELMVMRQRPRWKNALLPLHVSPVSGCSAHRSR